MRVVEILYKINIDTNLEGYWNDGGIMDEVCWGLDVWGGRKDLEKSGVEGFGIFLGRFLEEDGIEAFGSLNVNFEIFSIFKSFKRDLGIHIALDFPHSLGVWECLCIMMDLGTHIFFGLALWVVDLCSLFCEFYFLVFTCQLEET